MSAAPAIPPAMAVARSRTAALLFFASLGLNAALLTAMMQLRADVYDPTWVPISQSLFLFEDYVLAWTGVAVLVVAQLPQLQRVSLAALAWCGDHPGAIAAGTLAAVTATSLLVFGARPLSMSEYASWFQSHLFAAGRLSTSFPPELVSWLVPGADAGRQFVASVETGEVAVVSPPGFAVILAPFAMVGAPWLGNPVLAALTVLVVHRLARQIAGDRQVAGLAVLYMLACPAFVINAGSFDTVIVHSLLGAAVALLVLIGRPGGLLFAGMLGSIALSLDAPIVHLAFVAPWILWIVTRRDGLRNVALLLIGCLPLSILLGPGWVVFLSEVPASQSVSSAFLAATTEWFTLVPAGSNHAASAGLIGGARLWVWTWPGLLLLACIGALRFRRCTGCWLLAASVGLSLLVAIAYPAGPTFEWGWRESRAAWFAIPILAALTFAREPNLAKRLPKGRQDETRAYTAACAVVSMALLNAVAGQQVMSRIMWHRTQAPSPDTKPAIVFIDARHGYYAETLVQNDPLLREPLIRLISRGRARDEEIIHSHFTGYVLAARDHRGSVWMVP